MHNGDLAWQRMHALCEELQSKGWTAIPSRETHSCVLRGVKRTQVDFNEPPTWEESPVYAEIFISDDDLLHDDYREIVLRKMSAAVGHMRLR